jgi:CDP-glycerol glycerophosphotransferase (TagB/SpsB family)
LADYNQDRYPLRGIKKIQIYHGIGPKNYFYDKGDKEMFYLVPGYYAANKLKAQGKQRVAVVGYPKTDGFFVQRWRKEEIYRKLGAKPDRKTVLYTPTWGWASTAPILYEPINTIGERYNVIVKLHDHSPEHWRILYRSLSNVIYCEDADPTAYQFVADLLVSDFSSTIFEYAQLKRPIVSVGVDEQQLHDFATDPRWWDITCKVSNPEELAGKVSEILENGWRPSKYYLSLVKEIFRYSDGNCARRAAQEIQRITYQTNSSRGFKTDISAGDQLFVEKK